MWQQLITYLIVALSAAWLVWHLFLPAALRQRLRPGKPVAQGCGSGGCNDCATGCAPTGAQPVVIKPAPRR
ncbi:hypothetical protein A11A3_00895 [Alcanivorax hongdengensis A-11-3]|uniref:FeoB-associated Cys-rich membrane protein n=1 Tax=Alcanivorax hongdengensis A-11-3 TaxID=1177179 RepID=L0WIM2_9GAMM|nr:hypothetical protein [Alcanivorax hongdengensis]EKF76007.1 hypothetical protein A11A3_00895 [Alcanivorax hongdengensis A-11-3]